jgi:malate dehydrogenase (oxaloacetate-decarboxylating)
LSSNCDRVVSRRGLTPDAIVPSALDTRVAVAVASAVADAARREGVVRGSFL